MIMLALAFVGLVIGLVAAWTMFGPQPAIYSRPEQGRDWYMTSTRGLLFGAGGIVVGAIVGMLVSLCIYEATVDEVPRRFPIVSLGDGAGTEGRMFLGSGSVDTEAVFFYYAPKVGGGYGLFHVDADQTTIYEDQTNSGYLIKQCEDAHTAPDWLFGVSDEDDRYDCTGGTRSEYEFHVPKDSIVRQFNLDAN